MTHPDNAFDQLIAETSNRVFSPSAYYDRDGDCIEFFLADEAFVGKRLDKWVTVYVGRDSGALVGSLIKNIRELLAKFPGLRIDIVDQQVQISHLLRAHAWSAGDEVTLKVYKDLITKVDAEHSPLAAQLSA